MYSYWQLVVTSVLIVTLISTWEHVYAAPKIKLSPYYANQTACFINGLLYEKGDLIPSDHPCEICRCRPPGFSCSFKHCPPKPVGCRTIDLEGQCCPDYDCGCTYDGRVYYDGQRIPHSPNPCVTCYCKRNIVRCALNECRFRYDCEPEYVPGQCCPKYDHCSRNTINHKNKFRSSSQQDNLEVDDLIKDGIREAQEGSDESKERSEDTTEVVTVMKNEHRAKSSLMNDAANRLNLRRKKVYIGPNNKLLPIPQDEDQLQQQQPMVTTTTPIPTTTGRQLVRRILNISGFIDSSVEPIETKTTTEPILIRQFVDEVTSETRKPPYELDFEELHQSTTTTAPQSDDGLKNQDPLMEIITTEVAEPAVTIASLETTTKPVGNSAIKSTKSTSSPVTLTTIIDEIVTDSSNSEPILSREEPYSNIQSFDNNYRGRMVNQPSLVNIKMTNNNKTMSSPSYVKNIYKSTVSFITGLIGRFG